MFACAKPAVCRAAIGSDLQLHACTSSSSLPAVISSKNTSIPASTVHHTRLCLVQSLSSSLLTNTLLNPALLSENESHAPAAT